ncbi:hypothetical protein TNCT_485141 [Trichonephila clavata]|uniref:Uncharacterized protein n=1 Tax=Trichonephila clavata TaxID=2740835 RepID=A0A8X6IGW6_TRICU|nr:hypothetical protein TNCT_485141 [Trichonephila clavata]
MSTPEKSNRIYGRTPHQSNKLPDMLPTTPGLCTGKPQTWKPSNLRHIPITQHQKDIATVDILMERIQCELASSYPCPNTDCYAHNKIPELTHLEDGLFIWHHTHTIQTPPPPKKQEMLIKRKLIRKVSPPQLKLKN